MWGRGDRLYKAKCQSGVGLLRIFTGRHPSMYFHACIITCFVFTLQLLSALSSSEHGYIAPLSPLYDQDPHDVRNPSLPRPSCAPVRDQGIRISPTIQVIAAFCLNQRGLVSTELQQPITHTSTIVTNGSLQNIRLGPSWIDTGTCPRSQLSISPSQDAGRLCKSIFNNVMLDCKRRRLF